MISPVEAGCQQPIPPSSVAEGSDSLEKAFAKIKLGIGMSSSSHPSGPSGRDPDPSGLPFQIGPADPEDLSTTLSDASLTRSSMGAQPSDRPEAKAEAGLASLILTLVELVRQLMEAQVVRRMEAGRLSDHQIEQAGQSLQALQEQILRICEILDIDPADLNIHLGELGSLLPPSGTYYPGQPSSNASILELLDRLITTGIVVDGEIDIGLAELDLIHARLKLVLTSQPLQRSRSIRSPDRQDPWAEDRGL